MSALAISHMPETEKENTVLQVSELRLKDVIVDGIELHEPVTVRKVFDPEFDQDVRCLTLVNARNGIYYRQYSSGMEVTISN